VAASLFKRSLATLAAAMVAAALVFAVVGSAVTTAAFAEANAGFLERSAAALAATLPEAALSSPSAAAAFVKAAAAGGYRATLIAADGKVLADSEADAATMDNHRGRPEVAAALTGEVASSRRKSATIGEELAYAAAPVPGVAAPRGALRLALRVPTLDRALAPSRWAFVLPALGFVVAMFAAAALFSRMTARPLAALAGVARAYGTGSSPAPDAGARAIRPDDPEETRILARTLDSMAAEIGARVAAAEAQGRELEAILDAMAEAVIALDSRLAITIANPAAEALFAGSLPGRGLLEATRSSALQEVASACLETGERRAIETALYLPTERYFQALAAPLGPKSRNSGKEVDALPAGDPGARQWRAPASGAEAAGVVLVLGDITELRRLERVRKDFVANVSHELRTPVQLVKGFAESLREGALEDPPQAQRFLGIIERNAERMESLIADLLSLASLEREDAGRISAERKPILPILEAAREAILPKAQSRGTAIVVECPVELEAKVDAGLLEQALINLVDNAIKYSPPDKVVRVGAARKGDELIIEVKDQGIGIPARDLPRIFERFYRVDKARSRELGGTGLGLAIVRHIAIAHGGDVSVESWEGEGSTFRIVLPLRP